MPSHNTNRGRKRARECRANLGIDPRAPLDCLLTRVEENLGLPVVIAPLGEDVAGACTEVDGFRLLFVNGEQGVARQRFTLAHELGHVRCGHDASQHYDSFTTLGGQTTSDAEVQANAFAGELLAPAAGLAELLDDEPRLEHVVRLASAYGLSAQAMVYALQGAGVAARTTGDGLLTAIDAGEHVALAEELGIDGPDDRLHAIHATGEPYLSAALEGSALAAYVGGRSTVEETARAAGVAAGTLRPAVERVLGGADATVRVAPRA